MMDTEEWREIEDFPGYDVSSWGRVRSWWVRGWPRLGSAARILKIGYAKVSGYGSVNLVRHDPRQARSHYVHRLVLHAFVGPCPDGMEGRHFPSRDKRNNRLDNLSYSTHQENMDDQKVHGTVPKGDRHYSRTKPEAVLRGDKHWMVAQPERVKQGCVHHNSKLTVEQYDEILRLLGTGLAQHKIGKLVGVSQAQVSDIKTGKRPR